MSTHEPGQVSFVRSAAAVAWKDLVVELRSREVVYTMTFLAAMVVLLFAFAFVREGQAEAGAVPGILWVSVALGGTLGLGRAFDREREGDTFRALLLSPASRAAVLTGKAASIAAYMLVMEAVTVPLVGILFHAPLWGPLWPKTLSLLALLAAATVGFATVGAVFAAMLLRVRAREALLPVVLYPIVIPVLIAGVKGTDALLQAPADLLTARFWITFIAAYDALVLTLALWAFEPLTTE